MTAIAAVVVSISVLAAAPARPRLLYVQASGAYEQATRPGRYQPLNLVDGKAGTGWCSPTADPLNELLTVGFSAPVRVEAVQVSTGNGPDAATFTAFARARKLVLKAGRERRELELEDVQAPQTVKVEPPLTSARFRVEVVDQFPADEPDRPVCLTELSLVQDGKPLTGAGLAAPSRAAAPWVGTWYAGSPGAPDRFLTLGLGGRLQASFEPFDASTTPPWTVDGSWEAAGGRLSFGLKGKRWTVLARRQTAAAGGGSELKLEGALPKELAGPWRDAP